MVSIILPCYNAAKYLSVAIDSVLNQTYQNWELIIINDGSSDNSEGIIMEYQDHRIRYHYHKNCGTSKSRNVGLERMKGDYFCFLDADDFLPRKSLESRLRIFERDPYITFVDGRIKIFDKDIKKLRREWIPSFQGNPLSELLSISGCCFFGPSWMIRRDKNKKYRFHEDLTHGEDLLFYLELALEGGLYDYTEEDVLHYRKGHPSAMKNLRGLENGYHYIFDTIRKNEKISTQQIKKFKKKAGSIIFKSYLGNYQMLNALLSVGKKW